MEQAPLKGKPVKQPPAGGDDLIFPKIELLLNKYIEHFRNCIVFPIVDELDAVVGFYGRAIDDNAKVKHLYLAGKHKGVWNRKASRVYDEMVLTESIIDALSLIEMGIENVQALYGVNGFTAEHLDILRDDRVKTLVLAFDADEAGQAAGAKLRQRLLSEGFAVKLVAPFPPSDVLAQSGAPIKDWNDYLVAGGTGAAIKAQIAGAEAVTPSSNDASPAAMVAEKTPLGYDFTASGVRYRLTNVKEMFVGNLKVNLKAELAPPPGLPRDAGEAKYVGEKYYDHVDLYSSRSRAVCSANIARIFGIEPKLVEKDIVRILEYLEAERDRKLLRGKRDETIHLTREEIASGMDILRDPQIFERVVRDMEVMGYVGEEMNKLLMFLAACSRKLEDPISVMVISQSAGGKTKLVETVERMVPPEDVISVTSLSDQALNYVKNMEYKFLVLGEAMHGIEVERQLRDIQSSHRLTRGVTIQDPKTGSMETEFVETRVIAACALTSTNANVNPENASRNFIIEVDESAEQTARVHEKKAGKYSLEKHNLALNVVPKMLAAYHAAGRLLSNIFIVNDFAQHIRFPTNLMRTRRDFERFLDLIAAACFVRQFQKKRHVRNNIEYIKCDLVDYEWAYRIIMKTLASTLFELATGTFDFYEQLRAMTRKLGARKGLKASEVSVTQRDMREHTGANQVWIKRQLRILVEYEYVIVIKGGGTRTRGYYRIREDEAITSIDLSMIPKPEEMAELIKNDNNIDDEDELYN